MDPVEIVRSGYEAFGRGDIPAVMAMFDPSIEWYSPDELPTGGTFQGPEAVLGFFSSLPGVYEELRVEPDTFLGDGDEVIVLGHHRGTIKGTPFEVGFAHSWTLRDGKSVRMREYTDTGKILALLG